jgi:hypothetical protein
MKKKPTSKNDMVEWVVEEAFVKAKRALSTNIVGE